MPFNLINALTIEQKFMNNMFQDILNNYIISYLNNTLVYFNEIFKNHIQKVKEVLNQFKKYKFYFKFKKCFFHQIKINYLKHIVGQNNIKINLKKFFLIFKWPTPNNIKNIQFFLNFINFNK